MAQNKQNTPHYKLVYFDVKGRAEPTRMMFKLKDVPFEDVRVPFKDWKEMKPTTPFGSLPILVIDNKTTFAQCRAIERYVAKKLGLYGATDLEQAKMDMMVDGVSDLGPAVQKIKYSVAEEDKPVEREKFEKETAPPILANLEKLMTDDGHCVGDQISWGDIMLYSTLTDTVGMIDAKLPMEQFPKLQKLLKNIEENPKLAAWIRERPKTM